MKYLDFSSYPLWVNLLAFAVGAVVVWRAGTRLSRYVDAVSQRTGVGEIFLGMLLLGGITSLPEVATTVTASLAGNAPLAVNNLLGGIAMQVTILALADFAVRGRALSTVGGRPALLLQGLLLILALAMIGVGIIVGDVRVAGISAWSAATLGVVLFGLFLIQRYESHPRWEPVGPAGPDEDDSGKREKAEQIRKRTRNLSTSRLSLRIAGASLAILAAGFVVARTGDALSVQTGLGASFMGAVAVAIATSLPEISTTLGAARLGQHRLALSNIFGTNLFDAGLLFFADLAYRPAPVLNEVGAFSQVAALLGVLLTTIYLIGIAERQDKTALRMGYDSLLVLVLYGGGLALLYSLR